MSASLVAFLVIGALGVGFSAGFVWGIIYVARG